MCPFSSLAFLQPTTIVKAKKQEIPPLFYILVIRIKPTHRLHLQCNHLV